MATTHIPDALQAAVSEFTNFLSSPLRAPADQYEVVESRFDCLKLLTQRLERSGFYRHDELKLFKEWFQAETDPWLLASSMVSRARLWPEGYPGDYLTLEMVYANVPTGDGVARHIDRYLGPAEFRLQAFRGRQELQAQPARPSTNDVTYTQKVA
jgi:hypothetical protein